MTDASVRAALAVPGPSTDDLEYVGFGPRFWASVIDSVLVLMVFAPLYRLLAGPSPPVSIESIDLTKLQFFDGPLDVFVNGVLPAVAILVFWFYRQATPGKMAIRASIVDADTGARPTTRQLILRYVGYYLSLIPLGFGFLWIAIDARKQGWHDKMANTVVVRPRAPERVQFRK
jgi:uncharacterized RDD family membrane protein YckC